MGNTIERVPVRSMIGDAVPNGIEFLGLLAL